MNADAVRQGVHWLFRAVVQQVLVQRVKLTVGFVCAGDEGERDVAAIRYGMRAEAFAWRAWQVLQCRGQRSNLRSFRSNHGAGRHQLQVERQVGIAGHANLAANQPVHIRLQMHIAGLVGFRSWPGLNCGWVGRIVLIAVIRQALERQSRGRWKLQLAGRDALGKLPLHAGWKTGETRVLPVNVPLVFQREDEAHGLRAAGGNLRAGADHLHRHMLALYRARTAVCRCILRAGTGSRQQQDQKHGVCGNAEIRSQPGRSPIRIHSVSCRVPSLRLADWSPRAASMRCSTIRQRSITTRMPCSSAL